jgi:PucR C-terminal helix-turn-helix domain
MTTDRPDPSSLVLPRYSAAEKAPVKSTLAITRLQGKLPRLATSVVSSLLVSEPAYRDGCVPPEEPVPWISKSIGVALDALLVPPAERLATDWPRTIGHRRARQGVPMRSLLRAYHVGGQILCKAITEWTREEAVSPDEAAAIIDDTWDIVDLHSAIALEALRATEEELSVNGVTDRLLDGLLNGETDRATAAAAARAFALPEHGRYAVIVRRPADDAEPLDPLELPARIRGARVLWRMHGETAVGIASLGDLAASALGTGMTPLRGRRVGISGSVEGLTRLGEARQLAELAARSLTKGEGVASLEEQLPALMLTARPDLGRELELRVLAPVLALDRTSRDLLLDTLAAWLAAEGSATRAAEELYCHRNTVLNRLRRLESLTQRSLNNPKDLVEITLALEATRLRGN